MSGAGSDDEGEGSGEFEFELVAPEERLVIAIPPRSTDPQLSTGGLRGASDSDGHSTTPSPAAVATSSSVASNSSPAGNPGRGERRRRTTTTTTNPHKLQTSSSSGPSSGSAASSGSFPTPFKCCGEFCDFHIQQSLVQHPTRDGGASPKKPHIAKYESKKGLEAATAMELLFSADERQLLGDQSLLELLDSVHLSPPHDRPGGGSRSALGSESSSSSSSSSSLFSSSSESFASGSADLRIITYKSIALAKPNRQHLTRVLQAQRQGQAPPTAVAGLQVSSSPDKLAKPGRKRSSFMDPTLSHEIREGYRARVHGEMEGGVANLYRQVRVCRTCYAIYTLLDRARELAAAGKDAHALVEAQVTSKRRSVRSTWVGMVDREVERKEKLYLRHEAATMSKAGASGAPSSKADNDAGALHTSASAPLLALPVAGNGSSPRVNQSHQSPTLPVLLSPKATGESSPSTKSGGTTTTMASIKSTGTLPTVHPQLTTSKPELNSNQQQPLRAKEAVVGLDKYLRGESAQIEERVLREGELFAKPGHSGPPPTTAGKTTRVRQRTPAAAQAQEAKPLASLLLVDADVGALQQLHDLLRRATLPFTLELETLTDGTEALKAIRDGGGYDLILIERTLQPGLSGLELAKLIRQGEVQRSLSTAKTKGPNLRVRTPLLCVTTETSASDLQLYKDAGFDGCIGKPLRAESLLPTVQAALARLQQLGGGGGAATSSKIEVGGAISAATEALSRARQEQQERRRRRRRRLEAARSLALPGLTETDTRDYTHGVFQMDAETAFPYCVLGERTNNTHASSGEKNTFFNLVVIHDLFDTWERLQILLNPIVVRYAGAVQVLVWNYPGQAYTTWRPGTLLNNAYHGQCLQALLAELGPRGRGHLREAPFYLVGLGNGGNIATYLAGLAPPFDPHVRALVLVNSFSFVDARLAQFLHDCLKVFACTPESRPDLPVYFHTRFLFSAPYLARVTTPLALNLYTAVMNPITLEGRKALCHGALNHRDLRSSPGLAGLKVPFFSVSSSQNALVDMGAQLEALMASTGAELVDSIAKVLRGARNGGRRRLSSVVWLNSGHEVLQECKGEMLVLLEQLVTGVHELHDVPHQSALTLTAMTSVGSPAKPPPHRKEPLQQQQTPPSGATTTVVRDEDESHHRRPLTQSSQQRQRVKPTANTEAPSYEDTFIDRVLTTVNAAIPSPTKATSHSNQLTSPDKAKWQAFQAQTAASAAAAAIAMTTNPDPANAVKPRGHGRDHGSITKPKPKPKPKTSPSRRALATTTWDPTTPAFERLSANVIYKIGDGSKIYPDARELPEVKEYMAWRVQRNHKRLARMEAQVRVIQRAFRAFFARTLAHRLKRERCAIHLQRLWRAKLARTRYKGLKREDWAVRLVQRHWRGKMGRNSYKDRMRRYLAAREAQRIIRGGLARRLVARIRRRMHTSATAIQRRIRRYLARRRMWALRRRRNAAITIQRVFRGHVGRRRFARERDKLLFSRTQSQGITFGKQMLLEYKLYGTKLQSEVALLATAKGEVEREAEALLREICEFEEGIRVLEMEMHSLAQLETETLAKNLDEQAKWQLREQKMRLDREFTQMLAQIATRKEKLQVLEDKLQQLDKERLAKEEELKALERKLVILLEEQQLELDKIKQKQQTRSQLMLEILPAKAGVAGSPLPSPWGASSVGGDLSSSKSAVQAAAANSTSAYTAQQREEANSLMESTETMMKFGFMSMSMTYFSSMNMVRAMRKIGAHHMTLDSAAVVSNRRWPEFGGPTGGGSNGSGPGSAVGGAASPTEFAFQPGIPAGSFGGQQPLQLAGWSVMDVGRWLDTLALGQYKRAFQDAAVDGALLLHLNDEDLKNTLGMEHRLHRKKVLTSVEQLREAERIRMKRLYGRNNPDEMPTGVGGGGGTVSGGGSTLGSPISPSRLGPGPGAASSPTRSVVGGNDEDTSSSTAAVAASAASSGAKMLVSFADFCSLVRHGKMKQIKEALAHLPERRFDPLTVARAFAPGQGTVYDDLLEKSAFHINKGDENGNSPLMLAAQNNNLKVVQYLIGKGANPNHQNKHGQTAGHYAMAYSFFDLGAWLLDPEKGGGRDDILNENGLTPYDGLQ